MTLCTRSTECAPFPSTRSHPASWSSCPTLRMVSGTFSEGLRITQLPAVRAIGTVHLEKKNGEKEKETGGKKKSKEIKKVHRGDG